MAVELGVALLGNERSARALSERTGTEVVATSVDDHLEVARSLGATNPLVVGLAEVPWPAHEALHARGSETLSGYTGVVAWHALPRLLDQLSQAVAPGAASGAHVLVTAPDPGPDAEPSQLVFLREVAEGIATRVDLSSRSVAWRGVTREPTATTALTTIVEVHGRDAVVECPVAPGTGADPQLMSTAERLGIRVSCVDLGRASRIEMLAEVVETVAAHEGTR